MFSFIFTYVRTRNAHLNKKNENMRFLLVGITNGSTKFYHIAYAKENGEKSSKCEELNIQKSIPT